MRPGGESSGRERIPQSDRWANVNGLCQPSDPPPTDDIVGTRDGRVSEGQCREPNGEACCPKPTGALRG